MPAIPTLLNLALAVLSGILPVHFCQPTCGDAGGFVVLGEHAHEGHDAGGCGHEHESDDPAPPEDSSPCCEDGPVSPLAHVARDSAPLAPALVALPVPAADAVPASSPVRAEFRLSGVVATGPPDGVAGVVLLR